MYVRSVGAQEYGAPFVFFEQIKFLLMCVHKYFFSHGCVCKYSFSNSVRVKIIFLLQLIESNIYSGFQTR